jgi:hypothetical protein
MLSPGGKGWITKYFDLVEKDEINLNLKRPKTIGKREFMHLTFTSCGLVYGFPIQLIYGKNLNVSKWTQEEHLKVLLFEAHLMVYILSNEEREFDKDEFILDLLNFYRLHNVRSLTAVFRKEKPLDTLEKIYSKRVGIKMNLVENKWWVNSLSNAFSFLDVILFNDYICAKDEDSFINYNGYAQNALTAIVLAAYADGEIQEKEKMLFNIFLASSGLEDERRERAQEQFKHGAEYDDFSDFVRNHWMLKHFLMDIAALTIFSGSEMLEEEVVFLKELARFLECEELLAEEALVLVENFVLKTKDKAIFLSDSGAYEKVYLSFSNRWFKILSRNKDKIALELKESRQLIALIRKSAKEDLNTEEKERVKEQLKDLAKAVPALTIFLLPGGTILLPLLMKALPELIPTAFRDNQIESENKDTKEK